jgi:streptomycin 6-kinase
VSSGLDIPQVVRNKANAAGATDWLDDLPRMIEQLEQKWAISVGRAYPDPTEAYVAEALLTDGTQAVLKLIVPRDGQSARHEITALELAQGRGCALLFHHDESAGALLMERLGPALHDLGLPIEQRHEILCATVEQLWRPAPGCGLPTGAEKARWLSAHIVATWNELDRPCSEHAVEHALACAESRESAHRDESSVLVHGDAHEWNVLQSSTDGFKLVDPTA